MQRELDAQNRATDSLDFKQRLAAINADRETVVVKATAGCLVGNCALNGFNSGTPKECPVDECAATFDKGALRVVNAAACLSPINRTQSKYPLF